MSERSFDKKNIIPIIHFFLTFVFERFIILFDESRAMEVAFSVPLSNMFSYGFERAMCYLISKLLALVIIFVFWRTLFKLFSHELSKKTVIILLSVWILNCIFTVIIWPDNFVSGLDNYIPYSYALRLMPEYWHSVFLSCLYTASLMVLPLNVSIVLLQVTLYVGSLGYLFVRLEKSKVLGRIKYLRYFTLLMLLFRDMFNMASNPERAEYNASLLLIFVTVILIDILDKDYKIGKDLVLLLVFGAFVSTFRTECIVVVFICILAYLLLNIRLKKSKRVILIGFYFALVMIFMIPGKVGEIKYYGKDYSIINTFPTLRNILNSKDSNLAYEGAEEDLSAIDEIVHTDLIGEYGTWAYRRLNYSKGQIDFNQSLASKETAKNYMAAYRNIVLHNIPTYLHTQIRMFLSAVGTGYDELEIPYSGEHHDLPELGRELWSVGNNDVEITPGRWRWVNSDLRNKVFIALIYIKLGYYGFLESSGIYGICNIAEIICGVGIMVYSFAMVLRKRFKYLAVFLVSLALNIYLAALILAIPVGANMYFHAYINSMYAVLLVFVGSVISEIKDKPGKAVKG